MTDSSGGRWLFIGLLCGAALMVALYGLPQPLFGLVAPACDEPCVRDLDLQAQQAMAASTWLMFVVAALSTGIGAVSLWLIWRNLVATREIVSETSKTNETAIKISREQSRAYLDAVEASFSLDFLETRVQITYANAGQSPARRVRVSVDWSVERKDDAVWTLLSTRSGRMWKPALPSGDKASVEVLTLDARHPIAEELGEADDASSYRLVARGKISFDDVFGRRHHEPFQFRSKMYAPSALLITQGGSYGLERLPEPTDSDD